jgi:hypothetical protein
LKLLPKKLQLQKLLPKSQQLRLLQKLLLKKLQLLKKRASSS